MNTVSVNREELSVNSDDGIRISVRCLATPVSDPNQSIILLHGARVPSGPSFDLPVEGGSLAVPLATMGLTVYLMDARGYGASTRPDEMAQPNTGNPIVRADEVVRDIDAVVDMVRARSGGCSPSLLGWATGGLWAGLYASLNARKLSGVILYNPLYGGVDGHPSWGAGSPLEDPERPGQFNRARFGAYRKCDAADLLAKWDKSFPGEDIDTYRDPAVAKAYVEMTLASDSDKACRAEGVFRAPSGALEDSFYAMRGRQLYDASLIRCATLVIRCTGDFLAREQEIQLLVSHLVSSRKVTVKEIQGASHYAHIDRPEKGRNAVIKAIADFVGANHA